MNGIPSDAAEYIAFFSESVYVLCALAVLFEMRRKGIRAAARAALVLALVYVATSAIKASVAAPRPVFSIEQIHAFIEETGHSFPSAHSSMAFASAAIVSGRLAYLWAALIALSRLVLGVHYPHDVLFGAFLGYAMQRVLYDRRLDGILSEKNIFETRRQLFHAFFGTILAFAIYFFERPVYVPLFAAMTALSIIFSYSIKKTGRVPGFSWLVDTFERKEDLKHWPLKGTFFFLLGALAASLVFSSQIAFASVLILALGDSASTLIGKPLGVRKHFHNPRKTFEGTVAGVFAAYAAAAFFVPLNLAVTGALVFGIVESFDFQDRHFLFNDNLLVPLAVGAAMALI